MLFRYVLGSAIVTSALTIFHVLHTAGYRKKAGIKCELHILLCT